MDDQQQYMTFDRTSPLTGESHRRTYAVTEREYRNWRDGMLIQDAMPHLSPEEREFIISGVTPEEWDQFFGTEE